MSQPTWQRIARSVETDCALSGLDLVHPFSVAHYNAAAAAGDRLQDFGRENALGILIGNTRALWPAFVAAFQSYVTLARDAGPLDSYVVTRLHAAVAGASSARALLVFSHITTPSPFPIQRLAEVVGLAGVSPSHLAIHPVHGPWLALRAVVVFDAPGPVAPLPNLELPCRGCSAPCVPALERAVSLSGTPLSSSAVAEHAAAWIAVREACPVGQASRYGASQLRYHYGPAPSRVVPDP